MTFMTAQSILVLLLRMAAIGTMLAFGAVFLPTEFMAETHQRMGMGEFPRMPVVDYLTRSIAALYGFHGVFVWMVSRDPVRYHAFVWYVAVMNIVFGLIVLAIGLHAGLPGYWTAVEGPSIIVLGTAIAIAARKAALSRGEARS
jgi:hypothetical protein